MDHKQPRVRETTTTLTETREATSGTSLTGLKPEEGVPDGAILLRGGARLQGVGSAAVAVEHSKVAHLNRKHKVVRVWVRFLAVLTRGTTPRPFPVPVVGVRQSRRNGAEAVWAVLQV